MCRRRPDRTVPVPDANGAHLCSCGAPGVAAPRIMLIVALLTSAAISRLAGQTSIELEPLVGFYRPTQDLIVAPPALPGLAQQQTIAIGGRLTVWLSPHLGVAGDFAYSGGNLSGLWNVCFNGLATFSQPYYEMPLGSQCPSGYSSLGSFSASEWARIVGLELFYRVPTHSPTGQLFIGAGPAYVSHGGWARAASLGAVLSGGLRMPVRGTRLTICLTAQDYLYTGRYTVPSSVYDDLTFALDDPPPPGIRSTQFQNDFLVSAGASVLIGAPHLGRTFGRLLANIGGTLVP
jgi:hypothetical protein